jgi:hypothetical protein
VAGLCLFLSVLLLCSAFERSACTRRLTQGNSVMVLPGRLVGRAMGPHRHASPLHFDLPLSEVKGISCREREVTAFPTAGKASILVITTAERSYELYGIADVPMAINHLTYFWQENT